MCNKLISSLAGAAFILAASESAFAADLARKMPVKAPPPPPPVPVYSWTGWYVGGNVGYGFGRARSNITGEAPSITPAFQGCPPAGRDLCTNVADSHSMNGVIGGLQLGYNYQFGSYLAGIEADIQATGQRGTSNFAVNTGLVTTPPTTLVGSDSEKLDWLGTLRGRLGVTVDRWLAYGTGGLAYGRVGTDGSLAVNGVAPGGWGSSTA
jgi:outer membrane immunogenic protein